MHCHACWPRFCHDTFALLALNFYGVACTNNSNNHVSICHMHTYIRTTSMTATSSCSTAKLLQFVCKIVLQIEQERWRKQKAQSLLHTHTHTHDCKLVQSGANKLACRIRLDFNCNSKRASASAWACRLSEILIDTHNLFCQIPCSCMIV